MGFANTAKFSNKRIFGVSNKFAVLRSIKVCVITDLQTYFKYQSVVSCFPQVKLKVVSIATNIY